MTDQDEGWRRWLNAGPDEPVPAPGRRNLRHAGVESVTDGEYLKGIYDNIRTIRNILVFFLVLWVISFVVVLIAALSAG